MEKLIKDTELKLDIWETEKAEREAELSYHANELNKWKADLILDGDMGTFIDVSRKITELANEIKEFTSLIITHKQFLEGLKTQA